MKDKKDMTPDELIKELMDKYGQYFFEDKYKAPTTRYEAWLMASCLSNLKIATTLESIFDEIKTVLETLSIFQNQGQTPIIEDIEKNGEVREAIKQIQPLKRRKQ